MFRDKVTFQRFYFAVVTTLLNIPPVLEDKPHYVYPGSPNTFLTKNWKAKIYYPWINKTEEIKPWDLYRYARGYLAEIQGGRFPLGKVHNYEMLFKILGIPVIWQGIDVAPQGTTTVARGYMLVPVGIPDNLYKVLISGKYGVIAKTPINAIEQMLMHEGLVKDTTREERPYVVRGIVFIPIWGSPKEYAKIITLYEIERPES